MALFDSIDTPAESFPEALSYFAEPERAIVEAEAYMAHIADVKKHTNVPIIGAINAVTAARWKDYAVRMETGRRRRPGTGLLLCGERRLRVRQKRSSDGLSSR